LDRNSEKNEMLIAYALGVLNEAEAQKIEAQIAADATLRAELEVWRTTATNLVFTVPPAAPAPHVRDNILAAVRRTPREKSNAPKHLRLVETRKQNASAPEKQQSVVSFPAQSPRRFSFRTFAPAAVGVAAAALFVAFLAFSLYRANQQSNLQIAELNQKLAVAEQKLLNAQNELERQRGQRELLASPESLVKTLNGTPEMPAAKARLVFDPKTGEALLCVKGLPTAPENKVYQIWWISDPKNPAPGGTFKTNQNGEGSLSDKIPPQSINASVFAVTLEPEGGSSAPTGKPILISQTS
jgi:anti-sigma-K factor RskA